MRCLSLEPPVTNGHGRALACNQCGSVVEVVELPTPFLDEHTFVCGRCLEPAAITPPVFRRPEPSL